MAEIPTTHNVKSDDVHIAYQVFGDGPFDLLFVRSEQAPNSVSLAIA
jgi:hypothetical protein